MMILFVGEVAIWIVAAQGAVMNHQVPKYVNPNNSLFDARLT